MTIRYILRPGTVTSRTDGDRHFITAGQLARLYGVNPAECLVVPLDKPAGMLDTVYFQLLFCAEQLEGFGIPVLRPQYSGDYRIPGMAP